MRVGSFRHFAGTILLLTVTLGVSRLTAYRKSDSLAQPLNTIGRQLAGFTATENPPLNDAVLDQLLPTSYLSRTYQQGSLPLDLFVAFYAQQRAGESMHSPKHCLPGSGWEIWDYGKIAIPVGTASYTVNRYSISRDSTRMIVLYWYQSRERIIASEYLGKILLARDALFQNSTAASIVRIAVPDHPGTLEQASSFATTLIPEIRRCFRP